MATIKAVNSKASLGKAVAYVTKEEKTENRLISGKDCDPFRAVDDMKATKALYEKKGGRQYKHFIQSFHEKEDITPEQAHKIANELAENKFKGYECLVVTHTDKGHIHSHIIVNSVSFENGEKFRQSKKWLEQMKEKSDELCRKYNLTVCEKGKTFEGHERKDMTAYDKNKYFLLERADQGKAKSYVRDTALAVMSAKERATSREDFINIMGAQGYSVKWKDTRTDITFENADGKKVRSSNLENTFKIPFGKENLEHEFEQNLRRAEEERDELYNSLHAIADRERRIDEAYERFRGREIAWGDACPTERAEERSVFYEPAGERASRPSEAVRSITERVQKYSLEARSTFREHLRGLVEERRKSQFAVTGYGRTLNERKVNREQAVKRLNELDNRRSEKVDRLGKLNERVLYERDRGVER